ncbi:amidohydrolase [Paeniglutamicibacter gangotriensis]|uniref:Amidohydrolase n=1 Tax=Paeniglutamicibacter gangotriensis TaxID=254787 RepID=A0A5B0EMG8_9MICC|nr:amidohydrolase [Paeniglutamicibacter gangotriensis]KAA0978950.1 amidohydrolase [Paeniglutamicibacter gangotriensis]
MTAVAVKDGIITAVGSAAEALAPTADVLHDLDGGYLGPAFGDGHAHPLFAGLEDVGPQIRPCVNVDGILAEVARWANAHPGDGWIVGASYDATLAANGHFDARWLDLVAPDRPVLLRAWDYHTVWVNSMALELAGITADTPDPERGLIVRRADGTPLGTLCEPGAIDLVTSHVPDHSQETMVAALSRATAAFAEAGVSWVQDAWVETGSLDTYVVAAQQGALHTRMNLAFRADPMRWKQQLPDFVLARDQVIAANEKLLSAHTIKFFLDGIIESHTAHMIDAYSDCPGNRGLPNWEEQALIEAASAVDAMGFQLHIHAIGDAAVRQGLDTIEAVLATNGPRDRRPVMAHLQAITPGDLPRFRELGVIANFEPLWAQQDPVMTDLTFPRLGDERSSRQFQIGEIAASGVRVSFGSDWPVTHHHPMLGIGTAVTRTGPADPCGKPLAGALYDVTAALDSYSTQVAYQAFAEHERGTLTVGQLADVVWLANDPRTSADHEVAGLKVLGTWLAGKSTYLAISDRALEGTQ